MRKQCFGQQRGGGPNNLPLTTCGRTEHGSGPLCEHTTLGLTCEASQWDAGQHGLGFTGVAPAAAAHRRHHHGGVHAVHTDLLTTYNMLELHATEVSMTLVGRVSRITSTHKLFLKRNKLIP